jgi:ribokinase
MKRGVLVLGSLNQDMVLRCDRLPVPGETIHSAGMAMSIGGKGANQAVAAARLGASVGFVGCVGQDEFGNKSLAALAAEGISTAHARVVGGDTGLAVVLVESSGQNCIVLNAGANGEMSLDQVNDAAPAIREAGVLVCQLESAWSCTHLAMQIANQAGVPVLLNAAPARVLSAEIMGLIDLLVLNESEAAVLAGCSPNERFDAPQVALHLLSLGARTVLLTLGEHGVVRASPEGVRHFPAPQVQALDTTGAGDAFIGAFAAARCAGLRLDDAIELGQRVASHCVTQVGAMSSMPQAHELPDVQARLLAGCV